MASNGVNHQVPLDKKTQCPHPASARIPDVHIIDIRREAVEINLKEEILSKLKPARGPKTMPTLILYDERGLQLFEDVRSHCFHRTLLTKSRLLTFQSTI